MKSTDAAKKPSYKTDLFALIPALQVVDNTDKKGGEVESTVYEDEDDEAEFDEMEEDEDAEFGEDEEEDFEEGEMDEEFDEENESEEPAPSKNKKPKNN